MSGGAADNAIPTFARATICLDGSEAAKVTELLSRNLSKELEAHRESDPNGAFTIEPVALPAEVMSSDRLKILLNLIRDIPNGCLSMSADVEGLIQTSSNLGVLHASADGIEVATFIRSSDNTEISMLIDQCRQLAEKQEMNFTDNFIADAWKFNPDSKLLSLVQEAYRTLFGKSKTQQLHFAK